MNPLNLQNKKSELTGEVRLPASKSISNRLQIINALSGGLIEIDNLSNARDSQTMKNILAGNPSVIDVKDAGTAMRFLTAYYAIGTNQVIIKGTERMHQRPIGILVEALIVLGANIEYLNKKGYPPLKINPFQPIYACQELEIDSSISSQYISSLMMISPYLPSGLWLKLKGGIASQPYVNMTLSLMKTSGAEAKMGGDKIHIKSSKYSSLKQTVESDWSAASYWYSFLALSDKGSISLKGLNKNSIQGDSVIAEFFKPFGVKTKFFDEGVLLEKVSVELPEKIEIDFCDYPDLAQTIAVFCAVKGIELAMKGVESLKIKETNRLTALKSELLKLGVAITQKGAIYTIHGKDINKLPRELSIETYEDHRMAMAFAPLSLLGDISFDNKSVVNKSFPSFWSEIEKLVN